MQSTEDSKKCLIIDGNNIAHRSYHASQKLSWLSNDKEIYLFIKIFLSVLKAGNYKKLFVVFDEGKQTFRNELDQTYKSQRIKTPEQIISHIRRIQNFLTKNEIHYLTNSKFEADDLIASFIKKFSLKSNYEFHIFSQDKDLFQLLSDNVKLLRYNNGKLEKFGPQNFLEINKFSHKNFLYYLALRGDKVDNIKGIKGIGEKKATYLAANFHNLENTFKKLEILPNDLKVLIKDQKKLIEQNILMISLIENIPLAEWESYDFSWNKFVESKNLADFCREKKFCEILFHIINGTQSRIRTDTDN